MPIRDPRLYAQQSRFASNFTPSSYNSSTRTVEAILSKGSPVQRFYGTEKLRISREAVDLSRLSSSGIPLLNSHKTDSIEHAIGQVSNIRISGDALVGLLAFNDTPQGHAAEQMVATGAIRAVSVGYRVATWEVTDSAGNVVDPERANLDDDLTFTATRWVPLELSLCSVPADAEAQIRSLSSGEPKHVTDARARMQALQNMHDRQRVSQARSRMLRRASGLDYDPTNASRSYRNRII